MDRKTSEATKRRLLFYLVPFGPNLMAWSEELLACRNIFLKYKMDIIKTGFYDPTKNTEKCFVFPGYENLIFTEAHFEVLPDEFRPKIEYQDWIKYQYLSIKVLDLKTKLTDEIYKLISDKNPNQSAWDCFFNLIKTDFTDEELAFLLNTELCICESRDLISNADAETRMKIITKLPAVHKLDGLVFFQYLFNTGGLLDVVEFVAMLDAEKEGGFSDKLYRFYEDQIGREGDYDITVGSIPTSYSEKLSKHTHDLLHSNEMHSTVRVGVVWKPQIEAHYKHLKGRSEEHAKVEMAKNERSNIAKKHFKFSEKFTAYTDSTVKTQTLTDAQSKMIRLLFDRFVEGHSAAREELLKAAGRDTSDFGDSWQKNDQDKRKFLIKDLGRGNYMLNVPEDLISKNKVA
jgi:hypothetical protein